MKLQYLGFSNNQEVFVLRTLGEYNTFKGVTPLNSTHELQQI